ncbi:30S ribosomal protein S4 [Candidatus Berkelbacteria bacterium RIFCSPHIGHO2_12_FULL_36_9]|uniref:Small ribosomal subunit protein uS4 n=1 Tax=Candidatus Berkelbacteria bacterium RIFCSPHIGHO2_12_FULL_36_9 TaxID=1797469 RepID=A0A1F5EKP9_9BACT|nr:MAG: 30S ribosomal protein S4 [Candidatus Berkelbacteria bacterium RIFCSPHIGHO2_12_FULL_36_9]
MPVGNNVCTNCRREGAKLFLKGDRCLSLKCSFTKRSYGPGSHGGARRGKVSDYGKQLREKQKAKSVYNIRERQFQNYYTKAAKTKEATGEKLLQLLETRLDNVVYRLGFALSLRQARQFVSHKKILVNAKKVNIPSYHLIVGDEIEPFKKDGFKTVNVKPPVWLKLDKKNLTGKVAKIPAINEIETDIDEGLIVEFYNR